jgi:hypothetical protein
VPPTLADRLRHVLDAISNMKQILDKKSRDEFGNDAGLRPAGAKRMRILAKRAMAR